HDRLHHCGWRGDPDRPYEQHRRQQWRGDGSQRQPCQELTRSRDRPAHLAVRPNRPIQWRTIMRKAALSLAVIGLALPLLAAAPAEALSARTWVSGAGDDASPTCSRTAPCQTFATAIANTSPGGEINCLDAGSFGPVAIGKSITISCEAGTAGILVPPGAGIFINAATTD